MLVEAEAFAALPYNKAIEDFKSAYLNLGIPVSLNVHIVFDHVIQFCRKYDKGLGYFFRAGP